MNIRLLILIRLEQTYHKITDGKRAFYIFFRYFLLLFLEFEIFVKTLNLKLHKLFNFEISYIF
jgi:hypothetical protein